MLIPTTKKQKKVAEIEESILDQTDPKSKFKRLQYRIDISNKTD